MTRVPSPLRRGGHVLPVAALVAITAASLWPALRHLTTQALADDLDGAVFTWAWWWLPESITRGEDPFTTDLLFHPAGAELALTTLAPLIGLLTWPVRALAGSEAQVNVVQLGAGLGAALSTYALAWRVVAHRGGACLAGAAYTLSAHRFVHVPGHLNLIHTWVLPVGCLLLLRLVDEPGPRRAVILGCFVGAAFLVDPQLCLMLVVTLVVVALAAGSRSLLTVRTAAPALAAGLLVSLPLLVPMAAATARGGTVGGDEPWATTYYAASPLAWVAPPVTHRLVGDVLGTSPSPSLEGVVYPGALVLVLAVGGLAAGAGAVRRTWGWVLAVGLLLSLGPNLVVDDSVVRAPLPWRLVGEVPGFDMVRVPARFAVVGVLGLVVLASCGLAELTRRRPKAAGWLVVAALGITVLDLFPARWPSRRDELPPAFEAIADDPGRGAVLEVPIQWYTGAGIIGGAPGLDFDFSFLVRATRHEKPIVSGGVSRYTDERLDQLMTQPAYRALLSLQGRHGLEEGARLDAGALRAAGVGYVVYDRERPVQEVRRALAGLDLPVLADDGRYVVWQVPGA